MPERSRPLYDQAFKALEAAYEACFKSPLRGPLGMSHGPFSGVNEVLGLVARLEADLERATTALKAMRQRDDRNGSLPIAYREIIDRALAPPGASTGAPACDQPPPSQPRGSSTAGQPPQTGEPA